MQIRKEKSTIALLSMALLLSLATAVNIVGTGTAATTRTGMASVGLFADAYADTQCGETKIVRITASAGSTRSPTNAIDNNLSTRWTDEGKGSWIKPDLGASKVVCHVDVMWYKGNSRIYSFTIYTSENGSDWDRVYSGKSSGKTLNAERYNFADTTARWVKIRVDGNQWQNWNDITEIDVYSRVSIADTSAPQVEVSSPAHGSTITDSSSQITVQGIASDDMSGVKTVEVSVDGRAFVGATPRAIGDWSSWMVSVDLGEPGLHKIEPRATDNAGNQALNPVYVTFQEQTADTTNPTVAITSPTDGSIVNEGSITIQGTATDSESGISIVELRMNDGAYVEATSGPGGWSSWTATVSATSGDLAITARATDNAGNQEQSSISLSVIDSAPAAEKYFMATMLQYVDTDKQVNIYKPNMISSDKARIHVGLNKQVTSAQLNGLLSLPGSHGMEYFSLAEIKANAPLLKAKGIEFIDYDLEPGTGHSPSSDLSNPVASIRAASKAAHDNGLLFQCSPSKKITTDYGAQLAPYCDQYHIQAQSLQASPGQYESFVKSTAAKLRQNNPDIVISVQLSTQRESASGMTMLETMKHDFARVADDVDGISLWFSNNSNSLNVVESFAKWFDANYH
jgi:hypothetical protein